MEKLCNEGNFRLNDTVIQNFLERLESVRRGKYLRIEELWSSPNRGVGRK
jgi:hypothetical protein